MSVPNSKHKVYIYRNDYNLLCTDVYLHQNVATGGNLFGLWKNFGSAVIHVVLGSGQHCKRTGDSFQQDVKYMKRVDRFLDDYSLCHIGEWRSHHNLSLNKPSTEELRYISRIFPRGASKFLFIIANIKNGDTIMLSPYFFTDDGRRYEKAEFVVLKPDSTFSTDDYILAEIERGAEVGEYDGEIATGNQQNTGSNRWQDGNTSKTPFHDTQESIRHPPREFYESCASHPLRFQRGACAGGRDSPRSSEQNRNSTLEAIYGAGSNPQWDGNSNPTRPKPQPRPSDALVNLTQSIKLSNRSSSVSLGNQGKPGANSIDSSNTWVTPSKPPSNPSLSKPHSSHTSAGSSRSDPRDNPGGRIPGTNDDIRYPLKDYDASCASHPPASQHVTSAEGQDDPKKRMIFDEETPSRHEIKKIHDHLKYWYGCQTESMFKFETSKKCRDTVEISFKHNKNFWAVCFPEEFPSKPAELFCSRYEENLRITKVYKTDIVEPLDNVINILVSIKSRCGSISGRCNACRNFTRESLSKFIQNIGSSGELVTSASELVKAIEKSLTGVGDLAMKCGSESQAQITFKYKKRYWVIELPANYPEVVATVHYFAYEGSSQKCDVILHGEHSYGPQKLNTSELIIKDIISTQ